MRTIARRAAIAVLTAGIVFLANVGRAAGVTIVTHGYAGNVDGWVTGMVNQIPNVGSFPGGDYSIYKLTITFNGINYFYQWSFV